MSSSLFYRHPYIPLPGVLHSAYLTLAWAALPNFDTSEYLSLPVAIGFFARSFRDNGPDLQGLSRCWLPNLDLQTPAVVGYSLSGRHRQCLASPQCFSSPAPVLNFPPQFELVRCVSHPVITAITSSPIPWIPSPYSSTLLQLQLESSVPWMLPEALKSFVPKSHEYLPESPPSFELQLRSFATQIYHKFFPGSHAMVYLQESHEWFPPRCRVSKQVKLAERASRSFTRTIYTSYYV
jgi:hypothetical protein